jgi:hypothetical protein
MRKKKNTAAFYIIPQVRLDVKEPFLPVSVATRYLFRKSGEVGVCAGGFAAAQTPCPLLSEKMRNQG